MVTEINKKLENLKRVVDDNSMSFYYNKINRKKLTKKNHISIIIPVMGRLEFLKPLISSLNDAIKLVNKKINITIVEHSTEPIFKEPLRVLGIKYHWIEKKENEPFNKSLCHNVGAILNKNSDYFLFHDLDCLVFDNFFVDLLKLINEKHEFIQTFKERRLLYLNEGVTKHIIDNSIPYDFSKGYHVTKGKCCAPGGSILIKKELFINIGGFDPELFHSYSPEDQFFWDKAEVYTEPKSANNEMYHMFHKSLETSNLKIINMINYLTDFNSLNEQEKIEFLNFKKITLEEFMTK